jgi:hypothetical protein
VIPKRLSAIPIVLVGVGVVREWMRIRKAGRLSAVPLDAYKYQWVEVKSLMTDSFFRLQKLYGRNSTSSGFSPIEG